MSSPEILPRVLNIINEKCFEKSLILYLLYQVRYTVFPQTVQIKIHELTVLPPGEIECLVYTVCSSSGPLGHIICYSQSSMA